MFRHIPTLKNENLEVHLSGKVVEIEFPQNASIAIEIKQLDGTNPHESTGPQGALYRIQLYRRLSDGTKEVLYCDDHAWVMPDSSIISRAQWSGKLPDMDKYKQGK